MSFIGYKVSWCFVQGNFQGVFGSYVRAYPVPYYYRYIFGSRIKVSKISYLEVKVFMIKRLFYFLLNNILQHLYIDYKTRFRIYFTGYAYYKLIVMPMKIRVTAFTEYVKILLVVPVLTLKGVCGIKMRSAA